MKLRIALPIITAVILSGGCSSAATPVTETTTSVSAQTETAESEYISSEAAAPAADEAVIDLVRVYTMPTEKGGEPEYLSPDPPFQERLITLLDHQDNRQFPETEFRKDAGEYGYGFTYDGYVYEIWSEDTVVARPEIAEGDIYRFKNEELCRAVSDYVRLNTGITVFSPEQIEKIVSAELVYQDYHEKTVISSMRIEDADQLAVLEGWLSRAVLTNGGSACPFAETLLQLQKADGETMTLAMASDSCNMYFVNGRYYQYRDVSDNEPFFTLFETDPIIRAWRKGYMGPVSDGVVMTAAAEGITPESLTLRLYNGTNLELQYGEAYHLERLEDGDWQPQPHIIENGAFHDVAYVMPPGKPVDLVIKWDWLYGTLAPGEYRLVKEVQEFRSPGDYDTYELTAEFTLPVR